MDVASTEEVRLALAAGCPPERISHSNVIRADSTRFADATVSITGTGVEPSCQNPHLPAAAGYLVTFHRG
ncbi:hypothetical protein ACFC06_00670 [Nocardia sp. NPDC056064]|uniref:hypothetical protein n=1 Tax=Nocardia sp. NPDC056064 TaxID=3345701 RepID=UPI0035D8DB9F